MSAFAGGEERKEELLEGKQVLQKPPEACYGYGGGGGVGGFIR